MYNFFLNCFFKKINFLQLIIVKNYNIFSCSSVIDNYFFFANFAGLAMSFKGMLKSFCFIG